MNVIPVFQARLARGFFAIASLLFAGTMHGETHSNLQAVDANGVSAWNGSHPFTVTGVLLGGTDEMLDSTPNFLPWNEGANIYALGGEWQAVVQATGPNDRGGTTCWMGQCYGNMPWEHDSALSYSNEAWAEEINRLNHDPATGHKFAKGDLVQITARGSAFYGGKRNINEEHSIDASLNFDISLVQAHYGLPAPEVIRLTDIMRADDGDSVTHEDIFDASRATGGEHWQGMRVRINGLSLVTTNGWNPANLWGSRKVTATDGAGRYFTLRTPRYSLGAIPTGTFDAIGIFTQESGSGADGTFGYELFAQEIIVQESTPALAIALQAVISWPVSSGTYTLQSRLDIATGEWQTVTNAPFVSGGQNLVILPPAGAQMFYRLKPAN